MNDRRGADERSDTEADDQADGTEADDQADEVETDDQADGTEADDHGDEVETDGQAARIEVGPAAGLSPGERTVVGAGDRSIGVFNVEGEYFALENECAHQGGPVCEGRLQAAVVGAFSGPGERVAETYDEDVPAIACPWHGWEYDLRTGQHLGDPEFAVPTYDVVVEDDTLFVVA